MATKRFINKDAVSTLTSDYGVVVDSLTNGAKTISPANLKIQMQAGRAVAFTLFLGGPQYASTTVPQAIVLIPYDMTLTGIIIHAHNKPVGAAMLVDAHKSTTGDADTGTTVYTTGPGTNRPTIADGANSSTGGVPETTALSAGNRLLLFVDQVGSTTPGSGLTITIKGTIN
jgi:hypothetical protein